MHEGLRVDVLVVLHEVEAALEALVDDAPVVPCGQAELRLGRCTEQGPAELVEALALDDHAGRRALEGLHVRDRNLDILEPRRFQRLEAEDVADQARRHVGDRALLEQDDVVGHPREVLARDGGHRLDLEGLGAVAVTGAQTVGPDHRPGRRRRLAGHGCGCLDGIDAILRGDPEQAHRVGGLGHVVGVPVAHLAVLEHSGRVALLLVGDRPGGRLVGCGGHLTNPLEVQSGGDNTGARQFRESQLL